MTYCPHCMSPIEPTYKVCPRCGKPINAQVPAHHLLPGTVLNGKILIGTALGEGGFGITYIGRDLNLDIKVAVKEFFPNGYVNRSNTVSPDVTYSINSDREDFFRKGKERFMKEARILARFSTEPGVVEVRDFFESNNTAYIIMEYLDGMDLKQYLRQSGTLTPAKTLELLMPVMRTLTKIHAQGLIHRDISPDNIRMSNRGTKLLDFGAARDVTSAANKSLSVMLKPGYAPEEQYRSRGEQGPWTDVYALCATMYMCMTGTAPDDATQRLFNDELKPPSALGVSIEPGFERTLMKGMAVLQKDRFKSVDELIESFTRGDVSAPAGTFDPSLDQKTVACRAPAASAPPPPPPRVEPQSYTPTVQPRPQPQPVTSERPKKKSGKGILIAIISILLILGFAGGAAYYLWYNGYFDGDSDKEETTEAGGSGGGGGAVTDSSLSGAKETTKKCVENGVLCKYDVSEKYMLVDSDTYIRVSAAEEGITYQEYLEEYFYVSSLEEYYEWANKTDYEDMAAEFGEGYSVTVNVVDAVELTGDEKDATLQEIRNQYGGYVDAHKIEKVAIVTYDCDISGSVESESGTYEEVVVYIDGEWKVVE